MARRTDELRRAVGTALRRLRNQGHFSLDDVQHGTTEHGVRVTRSHLSRVETGQAELSLPRFLALVRVLGESPGEITETLAALLDGARAGEPAADEDRIARAMALEDPARAALLFRGSAARGEAALGPAALARWADAEAAIGRWSACERALSIALGPAAPGEPRRLGRIAVAHLGAGRPGLALALGRALQAEPSLGGAIEAAALLEAGRVTEAAALLERREQGPVGALRLALLGETHRRAGQARAALHLVRSALEHAERDALRAELQLVEARAFGDLRRPAPGLRAAHAARTLARQAARPELLARAHIEAARLHKLAGDAEAARAAQRVARVLLGRVGADRRAPRALPLQALWDASRSADGLEEGGT